MKKCAYCGFDNAANAIQCQQCGTDRFVDYPLIPHHDEAPAGDMEKVLPVPDVGPGEESMLCHQCLFPNHPEATWCKNCGEMIGSVAVLHPLDNARMLGNVWRGALRGHPKTFVLVFVWLFFVPGFVTSLSLALTILGRKQSELFEFGLILYCFARAAICFSMVYQVTKNFKSIPKIVLDE